MAWPCTQKFFLGWTLPYFELDTTEVEPTLFAIVDLEPWEVFPLVARSWMWQIHCMPAALKKEVPGTRLFASRSKGSLQEIAAREAFWDMKPSFLKKLASMLGIDIPADSGATLCGILFHLVSAILATDEEATMEVLAKRLALKDRELDLSDGVMQLDEALEILEKTDQKKVEAEKKHIKVESQERHQYSQEYKEKMQEVRATKGRSSASGGPKAAKRMRTSVRQKVRIPSVIPQGSVKDYCPPGAHIWVGNTKETWNGHMPPRKRISASWSQFRDGEQGALRNVLQRLWAQYAELQGLPVEEFAELPAVL